MTSVGWHLGFESPQLHHVVVIAFEEAAVEPVRTYSVDDTDVQLSKVLDEVQSGHEVVLQRAGKPIAKIIPLPAGAPRRKPGLWRGRVVIRDDFDELDDDTAAAFRGELP